MFKTISKTPFILKKINQTILTFQKIKQNLLINNLLINLKTKENFEDSILQVNRNARKPKRANHGARPCSSYMRRLRRKNIYKKWREDVLTEPSDENYRNYDETFPIDEEDDEEDEAAKEPKKETKEEEKK